MAHLVDTTGPASVAGMALLALALPAAAQQQEGADQQRQEAVARMQQMTQADGYLDAHRDVDSPIRRLGGPLEVSVTQDGGGVFVSLPARRDLDPDVFGTPDLPRAFAGTPIMTGVPPALRGTDSDGYTEVTQPTPFGDAFMTMGNASLSLQATDLTAADAATTEDSVTLEARWQDGDGNTYAVTCCHRMAAHGLEYPTFGGVVTNHLLHGFSGVGTPLMPTEFAYLAFWGIGDVLKNGEVVDGQRLVHGMLTEYVRTDGYELAFDSELNPQGRHFHLMVAPMQPDPEQGLYRPQPVQTGFTLQNDQPLPFWHVMFESIDVAETPG